MSLENPNTLNDFVELNPASLDQRSEGDDHIRNIKRVLKSAMPGLAGRMWRVVSRGASAALGVTDNMTVQNCGAGITLTPGAANALGNGWCTWIKASTTGQVTVNPNENVNGGDTFVVPAGYVGFLFCDGLEFHGFIMNKIVPVNAPPFTAGTRMLFQQTTAPSGWTKEVGGVYNDSALRFTSGTVGTGGSGAFSTVFAAGRTSDPTTLSIGQIPSHAHGFDVVNGIQQANASNNTDTAHSGSNSTGAAGGGGSHTHGLPTFAVKFTDVIIAAKD